MMAKKRRYSHCMVPLIIPAVLKGYLLILRNKSTEEGTILGPTPFFDKVSFSDNVPQLVPRTVSDE
eukprot:scaffold73365_cov59-Cyclotella_meneghiniana.AAC.3